MTDNSGLRSLLGEKMGAQELETRLTRISSEAGGLLDDEAVLALMADEQGMTQKHFSSLAELSPDSPVSVCCTIDSIEPPRTFGGNDHSGRLRRLRIFDGSAAMTLILWNEEVELVEQLGLRPGSAIKILSAVLKMTRYGPQIHVGSNGFIVLEEVAPIFGPPPRCDIKDLDRGHVIVKGVLLSLAISGRGKNRSARGRLFDGTGETDVVFSDQALELLSGAVAGTEIEIWAAEVVSHGGQRYLRCDERARVRIL